MGKITSDLPESSGANGHANYASSNAAADEPIAIIGMNCRFPGANNPEEYWDLLINGRDATSEVPDDRHYAEEIRSQHIKRGGFLKCSVEEFDAQFFNVPADKAAFLDPQQRLLLEVAWEALERAGINPQSLKAHGQPQVPETGVFVGVWSNDYRDILQKSELAKTCEYHIAYLSFALGVTAARISHFLGLRGPHASVDAGCSSSLYSVYQACQSLRGGECSLAISAGVNLILHPAVGKLNSLVLAPDGRCKSFDTKANGFARAEGCGLVLLKRLSDAERDNNKIYGIIRGIAVNSDATAATFGTPSRTAQADTIRKALRSARLNAVDISYVEAHGTGTEVGDTVEISAIGSVYSEKRERPLIIASAKPNIGHAEAAAGMAGLIKVILAMKHETIPPHINFTSPHVCVDLDAIPAIIPIEKLSWPKCEEQKRLAGVSTFGLGGQNSHLIIEEPPEFKYSQLSEGPERTQYILTVSAKCEEALSQLVISYQNYFNKNPEIPLGDISHTLNSGRAHFPHRLAVTGKNIKEIQNRLDEKRYLSGKISGQDYHIAFLFSDHTSTYANMSKVLYESQPVFKACMEICSKLLQKYIKKPLIEIIWGDDLAEKLETTYTLPVIFSIQYSLFKLWQSFGIQPDFVMGYGIGEFAAAVCTGFLTLEDGMRITAGAGKLLEKLPDVVFLAVSATEQNTKEKLASFLNQTANKNIQLDISSVNSENEVVVVSSLENVNNFGDFCESKGIETRWISESKAIHSSHTQSIVEELNIILSSISDKVELNIDSEQRCGLVSGVTGQIVESDISKKELQQHLQNVLCQRVKFREAFAKLWAKECRVFIEIGPNPGLLGLAMSNASQQQAHEATWLPSLKRNEDSWTTMLSTLAKLYIKGIDIDWEGFNAPYPRNKLDLPTYPFIRQKYWAV